MLPSLGSPQAVAHVLLHACACFFIAVQTALKIGKVDQSRTKLKPDWTAERERVIILAHIQ
jgi:hypothetical protein